MLINERDGEVLFPISVEIPYRIIWVIVLALFFARLRKSVLVRISVCGQPQIGPTREPTLNDFAMLGTDVRGGVLLLRINSAGPEHQD